MRNRRQYKTEQVHKVDTDESEHLTVTTLNFWEASFYPLTG